MKISECMCENVCYCEPNDTISNVAKKMCDNHVGCIPVCDSQKSVVGILTDRDIILRAIACNKDANTTKVSDIMSLNIICCDKELEITEASELMQNEQIRRIPVTSNGKLVGILTLGDMAKSQQIKDDFVGKTANCICKSNEKNAE